MDAIKSVYNARIERKAIRETEIALSKLSDYDLADIGISRGEIHEIARAKATIEHVKVNKNLQGWV